MTLRPPASGNDWLGLTTEALPVEACGSWVGTAGCGATVVFTGTVRDASEGRPGVTSLEYEAYEEQATARLADIAASARASWEGVDRLVLLHRVGRLEVGETSVVVAVSTPHRHEAFVVARWCIDTVKSTVPIWKRETWAGGSAWSAACHPVEEVVRPPASRLDLAR